MTRSKTKPPIRKPVFDEENTLRFAAQEAGQVDAALPPAGSNPDLRKPGKKSETDRLRLTLTLKREIITRLEEEAARKEKSVDQIVEKLAIKHLGKH
jgi:hypothetical protein